MDSEIVLQAEGMVKRFPGVLAVDDVDFELKKGEVLAVVGENGAGKSTLMKILGGAISPDKGEITVNGKSYSKYSPGQALDIGIGVIYQELNYLNDLTIAENIFLGRLPEKGLLKRIDYKSLGENSKKLQEKVGIGHHPFTEVEKLSVAEKQLIEIARTFSHNINVIILDEPTSALNDVETNNLFKLIKRCKEDGQSAIYISHRLEEVFEVSDRILVMRDGKKVATLKTAETNKQEVVRYMVGREIKDMYPITLSEAGEVVFEIEGLNSGKAKNISMNVRRGEIVGLFGLMGAGRTSIVKGIFGSAPKKSGVFKVNGQEIEIKKPADALQHGIVYIPSERKSEGLVLNHSVKQNITMAMLDSLKRTIGLDLKRESKIVSSWVEKLNIKTPDFNREVSELSGGNQQKVVLSKYLALDPRIIIMNEPTKGVDVGAKVEIYKIIEDLCKKGMCVIIISSEMPEIMALSERIIVVSDGQITGECYRKDGFSQETLMEYAVGRM